MQNGPPLPFEVPRPHSTEWFLWAAICLTLSVTYFVESYHAYRDGTYIAIAFWSENDGWISPLQGFTFSLLSGALAAAIVIRWFQLHRRSRRAVSATSAEGDPQSSKDA